MQIHIIIISFNFTLLFGSGLQLSVNLWGDFSYKMQHFLDNNPHNLRIIVILQFAKLSIWRDRPTVNTYFACQSCSLTRTLMKSMFLRKVWMEMITLIHPQIH
uniref:Uncharacterized protein n=1 Tax=Lactuca sativa TaxID=4236 RepID=A0A9R1XLE6_LACSA|nr:hypothetical protein LSAT_V11C400200870 [Lactuca sativa]